MPLKLQGCAMRSGQTTGPAAPAASFFGTSIGGAEETTQSVPVEAYTGVFAFFSVLGRDRACEMTDV